MTVYIYVEWNIRFLKIYHFLLTCISPVPLFVFLDIIVTAWTLSRKRLQATVEKAMFSLDRAVLCREATRSLLRSATVDTYLQQLSTRKNTKVQIGRYGRSKNCYQMSPRFHF
jgi:hypothetical protein